MLELQNKTPFVAAIVPGLDLEGRDTITIVVKATFAIDQRGNVLIAEAQQPLQRGDAHYGEPAVSSVRVEDETSAEKRGTDIVVIGHAWSGGKPSVDVSARVGRIFRGARVFGDRAWYRTATGVAISEPIAFTRMPLVWERAFGGRDLADDAAFDARNPIGVGYTSATESERVEGVRLPNIEDPEALIVAPTDRPQPVGFGYVGRHWAPRAALAGTYDEAWRRHRAPLLPLDFDARFFNGAALVSPKHLVGGEPVQLVGMTRAGDLRFELPSATPKVSISIRGNESALAPRLDTVILQPDERQIALVWRATEPCARALLHVDWVRIVEREAR